MGFGEIVAETIGLAAVSMIEVAELSTSSADAPAWEQDDSGAMEADE